MLAAIRTSATVVLTAVIASCAVNPVTGERELTLVSPAQQVQIGEQQYTPGQQSQGGRYYLDPELQRYVATVGRKLAAVSDVPNLPYEFVVLNNSVPNAWALPGGKIAINRGLLVELQDEAQLAAVLGHEIVHAAAGHGANQMSRGMLLGLGAGIAGIAASDSGYADLIGLGTQLGAAAWMASYGRDDELEADRYGMNYMVRAGYDPRAAVELQRTFVRLSEGRSSDFVSGLFASHPPSQQRVDANQQHAATLPGGTTNRDAYQRAIRQLLRDQPAYEAQERAEQALKSKDARAALRHLDDAVAIQPNESMFWELRGHAWHMLDDDSRAEQAFTTAIDKNPDFFLHWLSRGILRQSLDRTSQARTDLERSYKLLPLESTAMRLGEIAEARGETALALDYYRNAGQAGARNLARIEIAERPAAYIASGLMLDSAGNLLIGVRNDSPVTVRDVGVRLTQASGFSRDYRVDGTLAPGETRYLSTGLKQAPTGFRTTVIAARVN